MSNSYEMEKGLNELKVNELRNELEKRGLDKNGIKVALVDRLEHALKTEGLNPSTHKFIVHESKDNNRDLVKQELVPENESGGTNGIANYADGSEVAPHDTKNEDGEESNQSGAGGISTTTQEQKPASQEQKQKTPSVSESIEFLEVVSSTKTAGIVKDTATKEKRKSEDMISIAGVEEDKNTDEDILIIDRQAERNKTVSPPAALDTSAVPAKQEAATSTTSKASLAGKDLACSLWIRNITTNTKAADLKALFSKHGKVLTAKIFTTKNKQSPTCFGYVTLNDPETADVCMQKLNRLNFKGRVINVEKADRSNLSQFSKNPNNAPAYSPAKNATSPTKSSDPEIVDAKPGKKQKTNEELKPSSSTSRKHSSTERPRITATSSASREREQHFSRNKPPAVQRWKTQTYDTRRWMSSQSERKFASYGRKAPTDQPYRRIVETSRGITISAYQPHTSRPTTGRYGNNYEVDGHRSAPQQHYHKRRSRSPKETDKDEMLRIMRRKEEDFRKKEEELRLEREREKLKYEREKLEREKLELETYKLQAQLAQATHLQIAGLPAAAALAPTALIGTAGASSLQHHLLPFRQDKSRHDEQAPAKEDRKRSRKDESSSRHISRHGHSKERRHSRARRGSRSKRSKSRSPLRRDREAKVAVPDHRYDRSAPAAAHVPRYDHYDQQRAQTGAEPVSSHQQQQRYGHGNQYDKRFAYDNADVNTGRKGMDQRQTTQNRGPERAVQRRDASPKARGGCEQFFGSSFERTVASDAYMARTDPSYASRIGQQPAAHQQQVANRSAEEMFGNAGFENNASAIGYGQQQQYGRGQHQGSGGTGSFFQQNTNWRMQQNRGGGAEDVNPRSSFANANTWNASGGAGTDWNMYGTSSSNPGPSSSAGGGRYQSYGKPTGSGGSAYSGGRRY